MPLRKRQITYSQRPNHAARSAHARGDKLFRTYDTSYIRPKRSKAPTIVALVVALVVVALVIFGIVSLFRGCSAQPTLAEGQTVQIEVAEGSGASAIGDQLVEAGVIGRASDFTDAVSAHNAAAQLKPGTYELTGGMTADELVSLLTTGPNVAAAGLTIPEGYTLAQIASAVDQYTGGRISAADFTAAASDASAYAGDFAFLADAGTASLEGYLFPKTYEVSDDATADSLIRQMLSQFETETASLDWSYPESIGLSHYDAVKLASIVEKESTADADIRAQVASVFYNRLTTEGEPTHGMLQSDATTAYEVGHDPTPEDIQADSPYNTYTNAGLPPTPICAPSLECLQAVCSPAQTNYYFFYFEPDDSGAMQYYFSETYDEHMATFS